MRSADFTSAASDGKTIYVHAWQPETRPRGLFFVAHGMAEHGQRYAGLASALTKRGWMVCAPDHRGHGQTAAEGEIGWFSEHDGFRRVVDDLYEVTRETSAEYGEIPLVLFGHCMGSLIALAFAGLYGSTLSGCALSGVIEEPSGVQIAAGKLITAFGCLINGQMKSAPLLDSLTVRSRNREFEPARTAFEWLSRDRAEVDAYSADPLCGFICSYGFFRDLFAGFDLVYGSSGILSAIPPSLPFHVAAGDADPMGGSHGAVERLATRLRDAGVRNVQTKLYPGARHELLRETNRDDVIEDLRSWIESLPEREQEGWRRATRTAEDEE